MKNCAQKTRIFYRIRILSLLFLPLLFTFACEDESKLLACLPESRKLTDISSVEGFADTPEEANNLKKNTISDVLRKLRARCENNLLVDGKGKEIRFYNLKFCGGAAPSQEIMSRETEKLEALQKKYAVVTITCNPDGALYP